MGLFHKIASVFSSKSEFEAKSRKLKSALRKCQFEVMEPRQVLSADPVLAGITYLEGDLGQDNTPDYFEVTFEGGSETTQLTQFVINGDQDLSGDLSDGDMFFDVDPNQPGTGGYQGFEFNGVDSVGITASDIVGVTIGEDGLSLTVNVENFEAGDVLAFHIDVDEIERDRVDKIASGVEFETTMFDATFVDQHYTFSPFNIGTSYTHNDGFVQQQREGYFYDYYDQLLGTAGALVGTELQLNGDNALQNADRSAAALDAFELIPKPVTISGTVYHDENVNCELDANESGIGGVQIDLQQLNETTGVYENVASTKTDATGQYEFGSDLALRPGTYRLVEHQPIGFLNVGASAGQVEGVDVGVVENDVANEPNVISNIEIPLGGDAAINYDFKEVRPASLSGHVYHDRNDDGVMDSGEEGIANVLIRVTRTGPKDASVEDVFADTEPMFVRTNANGYYEVDSLPPGVYEVVEINSYPAGIDPLAAYLDGKDTVGQIQGVAGANGSKFNDRMNQIVLCADENGVEYNFGELKPAQISGFVSLTTPEGDCLDPSDPNHIGIEGVEIHLLDQDGQVVATTLTNGDGRYEFDGLRPGVYSIVEIQPAGYLDAGDHRGTVDGAVTPSSDSNDRFNGIVLSSDSTGANFNFCESLSAEICGTVWHDANNDGVLDSGEERIGGVVIQLFGADGQIVAEAKTDLNGEYCFTDLAPGVYSLKEIQPNAFVDGKDAVGQVINSNGLQFDRGVQQNDEFTGILLNGGDRGVDYDFGELKLAEISGFVHLDPDNNCVYDTAAGDSPLEGVQLELRNAAGEVIATTSTNAEGYYEFTEVLPGEYSIREIQPDGLFSAGQSILGQPMLAQENVLSGIVIESGQKLTQHNFCENEPAEIHGRVWEDGPAFKTNDGQVPDDYRAQRDGIYSAGVDTPISGVRMRLYYFIDPTLGIDGEIAPRPVKLSEVMGEFYTHLSDPDSAVWVQTDSNGEYSFKGLQPGNYIVLEDQPANYVDSNDTPGSTQGFTYNSLGETQTANAAVLQTFSVSQVMDSVIGIQVASGGVSVQNNFSEVRAENNPDDPWFPPPEPPTPRNPTPPTPGLTSLPGLFGSQPAAVSQLMVTVRGVGFQVVDRAPEYTWHLSVINAGQPRAEAEAQIADNGNVWQLASHIHNTDWNQFDMRQASWLFGHTTEDGSLDSTREGAVFGVLDGIPLAGDFDGDGVDEVAVYKDGFWYLDINGNGEWDDQDLLAKLGDQNDRPVVGDWDGDGKDDIGIYGPMWENDLEAIVNEPGLPNPDNHPFTQPKNLPPVIADATNGARSMKLTSFGKERADIVDHVFGTGEQDEIPVTGDWNGNGIRSIGHFRDGVWQLDINGDGEFDHNDETARFGQAGDIPLVGDFNGDGIEEVAVYRAGTWIIDSNGNRELDATDRTFELGSADDTPVTGDFDGDGIDDPALYRNIR